MKKQLTTAIAVLLVITGFAQRFEQSTFLDSAHYKKHYSHNIEGGFVDGQPREFIVGNLTDWGTNNYSVSGQPIIGNAIQNGKVVSVIQSNIQLTDFTVFPSTENEYAAGTGIYYPNGTSGMGYPFLGIYSRSDMNLISLVYYDISYPGSDVPRNSVGLRIKYSEKAEAFYISGLMSDRLFTDLNLSDLLGKSKGFIIKVDASSLNSSQVLVFDPDQLPLNPQAPLLCAVTDLEINDAETRIAFTGINTKERVTDYYCPMAGEIDLNLNVQWCNAYELGEYRYSGVDVEYSKKENLLVLMNCDKYVFSVMEVDGSGNVVQQPVNYLFSMNDYGPSRGHIMHFTGSNILITGNFFDKVLDTDVQHLFSYDIPMADNLMSGNIYFNSYSMQEVPLGKQQEVTSYWAPENSIYKDGNLSIVGIYNNDPVDYGYTLIHTAGFVNQAGCLRTGVVGLTRISTGLYECTSYTMQCTKTSVLYSVAPAPADSIQTCPTVGKSAEILSEMKHSSIWKFRGIDESGIHAILTPEVQAQYQINVYDLTGRVVYTSSFNVMKGDNYINLIFPAKDQLYLIRVSDGTKTETLKVSGVR
ncbi:MAG: T9SS type A sorting domain-containing protein [Lentimicrobium sp.]